MYSCFFFFVWGGWSEVRFEPAMPSYQNHYTIWIQRPADSKEVTWNLVRVTGHHPLGNSSPNHSELPPALVGIGKHTSTTNTYKKTILEIQLALWEEEHLTPIFYFHDLWKESLQTGTPQNSKDQADSRWRWPSKQVELSHQLRTKHKAENFEWHKKLCFADLVVVTGLPLLT